MAQYACLNELQTWLDSYLNFERTPKKNIFWLDTMEYLCALFDAPQNFASAFHIAGSKGKGSVSAMIASILDAGGYKTGLYASPHILDFVERIGSAHGVFAEDVYERAANELKEKIASLSDDDLPGGRAITWFELVTLYGFLCFRQARTDYNVLEVGLGGRLDATNVVLPKVCCITPIELEHTEFLGDTIEKVAGEKAGIIKEGVPVVVAEQTPEAKAVFQKIAKERHAPFYSIDEVVQSVRTEYVLDSEKKTASMKTTIVSDMFSRPITANLRLLGAFQAQNAALAAIAVKTVLPDIDEKMLEKGLENAILPGRFEVFENPMAKKNASQKKTRSPAENASSARSFVILDGAHTPNSVRFTLETMRHVFGKKKCTLLFACAADKDAKEIAPLFKNQFDSVFLTKPGNVKQSDVGTLAAAFDEAAIPYDLNEDFAVQIQKAFTRAAETDSLLLVTGSFYLLAEVKKFMLP
ncbi:MAG: bifunctional folylpolyglutamate synthase/dihydrofolate synthase [Treponema sp.]|nr:bifunctional folylpolyglutamate synthase/dihydrofolate synthase [Treponema sp.]